MDEKGEKKKKKSVREGMSVLPIDIWLQLLHERSFCAVPVAGLIAAPSAPQRRTHARRSSDKGGRSEERARRQTLSLADILMQRAQDVLREEDRARAARRAAGTDGSADLDDEDTFCDEETCRNTAINALSGAGGAPSEAAIARKMQAHRERERAAVESVRMQRAIDTILAQLAEHHD